MSGFKKIVVRLSDCEGAHDQIYIAAPEVTEEQIMLGDDTGVLCLCLTDAAAEQILLALNERGTPNV